MAIIDWPDALIPNSATVGIRKGGVQFRGAFNSSLQAVDTSLAERLTISCTMPQKRRDSTSAGAVEAFLFQLAGGVNKVRAYHFGRPQPAGTLRGSPTVGVAAARGDTSITLAGCSNGNLLVAWRSFDSTAWTKAAVTVPTPNTITDPTGAITGDMLVENNTTAQHGVVQTVTVGASVTQFCFSVYALASSRTWVNLQLTETTGSTTAQAFFNLAGASGTVGTVTAGANWASVSATVSRPSPSDGWYRCTIVATKNNAATGVTCGVLSASADAVNSFLGNSSNSIGLWGARLDLGATPGTAAPATLAAGDMIGVGNHLLQVALPGATEDGANAMVVPLINRIRETVTVGTAVTWNKPTSLFVAPDMAAAVTHRPGMIEGAGIDLEEAWP